jgi:hypothetical protein
MRTYSTGLTADVESTATSSSAGAIIDGVRIIAFCLQGGLLDN